MLIDQLDVITRVAGATLLLLAAATSSSRMSGSAQAMFIPLAVCLTGFLAGNTPETGLQLGGPVGQLAVILAGYAAAFLWWFCLAVFDASFRPRGLVLAAGAAWIVIASADRGLFGERLAQIGLSWALVTLGFAMVAHLVWRLLRDREGDLVDHRRRIRRAVAVVLGAQLLADLAVDLFLGMEWQPQAFSIAQNLALLGFTIWLLTVTEQSAAVAQPAGAAMGATVDPLLARLNGLMEVDKVYLDPELSFADFVSAMGASEKAVRRLINGQLGHDHFRTFLNSYRVAEARRRLSDPARRGDKLIALAMDSGFASLASFNRVFREMTGQTPSACRATAQGDRPGSEVRSAVS